MKRQGRRLYSLRERMLAEVIVRQMELIHESQQQPAGNRWEKWLKWFIFAASFTVIGMGLGLYGAH